MLNAAGAHPVAILATWHLAWGALIFALRAPERVSHLVLWGTATRGADLYSDAVAAMGTVSQEQMARIMWHSWMGWSAGDVANRLVDATLPAPGTTRIGSAAAGMLSAMQVVDLTDVAAQLRVPTLVLHPRERQFVTEETASELAASIPNARLALLDGDSLFLPVGVADQALSAINAFVQAPEQLTSALVRDGTMLIPDGLSGREVEVLRLVAAGMSNAEIADKLVIAQTTAARHVSHILKKTRLTNRTQAALYATRHGLDR